MMTHELRPVSRLTLTASTGRVIAFGYLGIPAAVLGQRYIAAWAFQNQPAIPTEDERCATPAIQEKDHLFAA
jgi:hypothetical protein